MGGRASRDKGLRAEREAVHIFQAVGIAAERVPLSGASGGRYTGDVSAPILGDDQVFEVKCRAAGFARIYNWLGGYYGLVIRADREEPLVVLRLRDFASLALTADKRRLGR